MQTLGLSSNPQPTDGLFKRLFWPTIESGYDVDLLGQQGFWLCAVVGVVSALSLIVAGWPTLGMIFLLAYFLGGCGVRERSIVAAVIVFVLYAARIAEQILMAGLVNPILPAVVLMLLFSNIRGTVLARMWADSPETRDTAEAPERESQSLKAKFANVLPAKLWPIGQFVFYPMAVIVLALMAMGVFAVERIRHQQIPTTSVTVDDGSGS